MYRISFMATDAEQEFVDFMNDSISFTVLIFMINPVRRSRKDAAAMFAKPFNGGRDAKVYGRN